MNANYHKLIKRISLLTEVEQKLFSKWLASPWCNSNKQLPRLFKYIRRYYADFKAGNLSKERLFRHLYPDKVYNDKWLRNIQSELGQQVERFLTYQRLEKDQVLQNRLLAEEFVERNQEDWYEKITEETIELLENKAEKITTNHLELGLLYEQLYFRPNASGRIQQGRYFLQQAEENLDHFYAIHKYRLLNEFVERGKILQKEPRDNTYHDALKEVFEELDLTAIDFYQQRLALNNEPDKNQFLSLKKQFENQWQLCTPKDQKILLLSLINDAARLRIQGHSEMLKEIFALYQLGLAEQILLHHGQLTSRTYANIVTVGNLLNSTDIIHDFIQDYTALLPERIQEDAETWAKAHTVYNTNQFEICVDLLRDYQFSNHLFSIQSRVLLLQAYFDLNKLDDSYYEYLQHYCISFEQFIRRDRIISKDRKKSYLNLIRYTKNLATTIYKKEINPSYLQAMKDKLSLEKNLQGQSWLLRTLEQL